MTKPQVSIIVPVYKVPEKYLRKCIESTMAQTLESIEILLVMSLILLLTLKLMTITNQKKI